MHRKIGQILIHMNIITHGQVLEARRVQIANPDKRIGEIMIELGHITGPDLEKALDMQRSMSSALES